MMNTFGWVENRTGDVQRAARFYERLFGWELIRRETADGSDDWILDTGEEPRMENLRRGGLWFRPDDADLGVVVYVNVEDIDTLLPRATDLSGDVVAPRSRQGAAIKAYVHDPDGNLLGLWQERNQT